MAGLKRPRRADFSESLDLGLSLSLQLEHSMCVLAKSGSVGRRLLARQRTALLGAAMVMSCSASPSSGSPDEGTSPRADGSVPAQADAGMGEPGVQRDASVSTEFDAGQPESDAGVVSEPVGCDDLTGKTYTFQNNQLWLPDCVKVIRGLIGTPEFASHSAVWQDVTLRKTAARSGLGILRWAPGCWYCATNSYQGLKQFADAFFTDTLPALAAESQHPELKETGIIAEGLSASSWNVAGLFIHYPERLIAGIPVAGGFDG